MPTDNFTNFVFVDFENVPKVDLGLVEGKSAHVTLLLGKNQTWLELPLVHQIRRLAAQVELVEVGASGRNALDLTLACYLGQAIQRLSGAEFFIVSKDKDFDAMLAHLQCKGTKVTRHDSFAALPFLALPKNVAQAKKSTAPKPKASTTPKVRAHVDKYPKLLEQIKSGKHRPGTRAKLMHHIHTLYGQKSTPEQLTAVIHRLIGDKAVTIDNKDKVTYL